MLEKELEKKFKYQIEKRGAMVLKFVSPGKAGVPDRLVLLPYGRAVFVEFKAPGEKPRSLQVHVMKELEGKKFDCWVIDNPGLIRLFEQCYFGFEEHTNGAVK